MLNYFAEKEHVLVQRALRSEDPVFSSQLCQLLAPSSRTLTSNPNFCKVGRVMASLRAPGEASAWNIRGVHTVFLPSSLLAQENSSAPEYLWRWGKARAVTLWNQTEYQVRKEEGYTSDRACHFWTPKSGHTVWKLWKVYSGKSATKTGAAWIRRWSLWGWMWLKPISSLRYMPSVTLNEAKLLTFLFILLMKLIKS